ncbi:MAG: tRNA pseudouridine(55) synthase TruB [Oscillospiraceae bacterium]|nr:tRNA pseudouridine(55) synthase TruB [Oscillospiraceae bacterium]
MAGLNDNLNGIICVNKPQDFTSFDVIAKMRGILKLKRLGHAGTLDPMATGVLPVFAGKATKACDIIPDRDKVYEAGFRLGLVTDTQDSSGTVTSERDPSGITAEDVKKALADFRGDIMQIPPMYSAVMINGQRLYDLARQGKVVEREARPVTVYTIELLSYDEDTHTGRLEISCSKGTYIRTLINDIGEKLGCGGIMTSLVRTKACGFSLEDCVTLEDLQKLAEEGVSAEKYLLPIEKVFGEFKKIKLNAHQEKLYRNGIKLDTERIRADFSGDENEKFRVYGADGCFIGTACADYEKKELRVDKNF